MYCHPENLLRKTVRVDSFLLCQCFVTSSRNHNNFNKKVFFCNRMNIQLSDIAEKKRAIFASTLLLINDLGFHGTSMSLIAQKADVATGTIYHYFKSKDDLIVELLRFSKQLAFDATFGKDDPGRQYAERFQLIWGNLYHHYIRHPEILGFFNQFYSSPYIRTIPNIDTMCFQKEFTGFIIQGIENGHVQDINPDIISSIFIGSVITAAKKQINGQGSFHEEDIQSAVTIIWDGIKMK